MKKINPSVNKAQLECFLTVFNFEYSCGGVNYTISTIIVQNSEYGHTVALKDQSVSNLMWQVKWKVLCFSLQTSHEQEFRLGTHIVYDHLI